MSTFNVELKRVVDDSYEIEIGYGLSGKLLEDLKSGMFRGASKLAIITDSIVEELYATKLLEEIREAGFRAELISFPAGEQSKTRKTKEYLEDTLYGLGFRRDSAIIAVGGGVVTDIAGFTAGTFCRGIPYVNYATTLLAAADASVGGKTAVDTETATNVIGMFNQPKKVYIDLAAWKTLPRRQVSSGLAETIKHACMADAEFFDYISENLDRIFECDVTACTHIAEKNCSIKYNVVMNDERETSLREILNLGHTVGRATETLADGKLLHGEALAIGLVAEARLSCGLGLCTAEEAERIEEALRKADLPTRLPEYIDRNALVSKLYTDKKVKNGKLRFVLQQGIGATAVFEGGKHAREISEEEAAKVIMTL